MPPGHLAEWRQWMQAASMSNRTITDRLALVRRFETEIGGDSLAATWQEIAEFLADERYSAGTRQTYHANLHAWFHWLVLMDLRVDDPMLKLRSPVTPRRYPRPVTVAQLGRMLGARMHRRTRAMILLGAYEGLRVSEIAHVRGEHIRGGKFRVVGKGGVDFDLPLHVLVEAQATHLPPTGFWFPSHVRLGPVTGKSVSRIIGAVMARAGVPGTAHSLRHFFGTETLKSSGGNLVVTQQLMRHANITSTAGYTLVDDSERRAAVAGLPVPLSIAQ